MAEKKKRKVKVSADRLEMLRKSKKVAGKSKSDYSARVAQNKGVKDGEIRIGKSGKHYNVWDAKNGRWVRGTVVAAKPKPKPKPKPKSNIKDTKASRIGGYTPGTNSQTVKDMGWWSNRRYPGSYS